MFQFFKRLMFFGEFLDFRLIFCMSAGIVSHIICSTFIYVCFFISYAVIINFRELSNIAYKQYISFFSKIDIFLGETLSRKLSLTILIIYNNKGSNVHLFWRISIKTVFDYYSNNHCIVQSCEILEKER